MLSIRPNYLVFLRDFIIAKLAYHLQTNPVNIKVRSFDNIVSEYDLSFNGKTYVIRLSNDVYFDKKRDLKVWDFDVRENSWKERKNKRVSRKIDSCDYYILVGMVNNIPKEMFVIPLEKTPKSHVRISVSGRSKYRKYAV